MKNRTDITTESLATLADVHAAELENGANAWVTVEQDEFVLLKSSTLVPDGVNVIAPNVGSPVAGNAGAKWVRSSSASGQQTFYVERVIDLLVGPSSIEIPFLLLPIIVFRDGGSVMAEYTVSVLMSNADPGMEHGTVHQIFLDGVLLPQASSFETLQDPAVVEEQRTVSIKKKISGLTAGSHLLEIRWTTSPFVTVGGFWQSDPGDFSGSLLAYEVST